MNNKNKLEALDKALIVLHKQRWEEGSDKAYIDKKIEAVMNEIVLLSCDLEKDMTVSVRNQQDGLVKEGKIQSIEASEKGLFANLLSRLGDSIRVKFNGLTDIKPIDNE